LKAPQNSNYLLTYEPSWFVVLVGGFGLYLAGMLTTSLPLEDLPQYWSLPLDQYLEKAGALTRW